MPTIDRRSLLLVLGAAAVPVPVFAAEPWQKEFSQWNDKDIQKILQDSPWAKNAAVPIGMPGGGGGGGRSGGRGGGRGGGGGGGMADASGASGGMSGGGGGGGGMGGGGGAGGGGNQGGGDMAPSGAPPTISFLIRWQSAAPVKAAVVRAKMGKEADTSTQAKEFIEKEEETYVVAVIMPPMGGGAPGAPGGGGDRKGPPGGGPEAEARIVEATTLSWKAHEGVHPVKVIMPKENSPAFVFHFAKTHPIELDDKEVEFATKRGSMEIKKKFKLKDMVYNGKLAL
jgi:hypothetical protein